MLKILRKNTKLILWILLIIIIPPFVFWGAGSAFNKTKNPVLGTVFEKKIRLSDFIKMSMAVQIHFHGMGQKIEDISQLEMLTWHHILLLEEAHRQHITISDQEIAQSIHEKFSIKGAFNEEIYQTYVTRNLNISILDYEKLLRERLMIDKLTNLIQSTVKIVPKEVTDFYLYENENIDILYTQLDFNTFIDKVIVNDAELIEFFTKNKEKYRISNKRNCHYIQIDKDSFLKDSTISDQEVEAFYEENSIKFKDDKGKLKPLTDIRERIVNELLSQKALKKQREMVEEIFRNLLEEIDLTEIAKQFGIEVLTSDFLQEADGLPAFKNSVLFTETLFKTTLNELSDPVHINDSFFFLQPLSEKESYLPVFDVVQEQVLLHFKQDKSYKLAIEKAKEIHDSFMEKTPLTLIDFKRICTQNHLKTIQPEPFNRKELISDFADTFKIKSSAFGVGDGMVSDIIQTSSGPAILYVIKRLPINKDSFEKETILYNQKLLQKKQEIVVSEWIRSLIKNCHILIPFNQLEKAS
ncbi:SurA N-terminal domain-containing protein [Chlamydiota bacterium]